MDDTIGYDSRLKHSIIPLLIKPGRITLDYIKGRRFFYVLPFRLYLITSLLLILMIQGVTDTDELKFDNIVKNNQDQEIAEEVANEVTDEINQVINEVNQIADNKDKDKDKDKDGFNLRINPANEDLITVTKGSENAPLDQKAINNSNDDDDSLNLDWDEEKLQLKGLEKMKEGWIRSFLEVINPKIKIWKNDPGPLVDSFFEVLPYIMFIILPIFAIFLKFFYAFSSRYYIEHLIFLLHNHAFIYMVLMLQIISGFSAEKLKELDSSIAQTGAGALELVVTLLSYWMVIYVFLAMKRFYQQGWFVTIGKSFLLGFIYLIMISFGFVLTLAAGAYQA